MNTLPKATSIYYTLKTATNIDLLLEFTADTLVGEEIYDTFRIMQKNMNAAVLDKKNILHIDESCEKKSNIKAKRKFRLS